MGSMDRTIRFILAALFVVLYIMGTFSSMVGNILLIVAAVFTLTSALSFCPLYKLVGISTCPVQPKGK
jgi:Protein of unknown function (DUF2892)